MTGGRVPGILLVVAIELVVRSVVVPVRTPPVLPAVLIIGRRGRGGRGRGARVLVMMRRTVAAVNTLAVPVRVILRMISGLVVGPAACVVPVIPAAMSVDHGRGRGVGLCVLVLLGEVTAIACCRSIVVAALRESVFHVVRLLSRC